MLYGVSSANDDNYVDIDEHPRVSEVLNSFSGVFGNGSLNSLDPAVYQETQTREIIKKPTERDIKKKRKSNVDQTNTKRKSEQRRMHNSKKHDDIHEHTRLEKSTDLFSEEFMNKSFDSLKPAIFFPSNEEFTLDIFENKKSNTDVEIEYTTNDITENVIIDDTAYHEITPKIDNIQRSATFNFNPEEIVNDELINNNFFLPENQEIRENISEITNIIYEVNNSVSESPKIVSEIPTIISEITNNASESPDFCIFSGIPIIIINEDVYQEKVNESETEKQSKKCRKSKRNIKIIRNDDDDAKSILEGIKLIYCLENELEKFKKVKLDDVVKIPINTKQTPEPKHQSDKRVTRKSKVKNSAEKTNNIKPRSSFLNSEQVKLRMISETQKLYRKLIYSTPICQEPSPLLSGVKKRFSMPFIENENNRKLFETFKDQDDSEEYLSDHVTKGN